LNKLSTLLHQKKVSKKTPLFSFLLFFRAVILKMKVSIIVALFTLNLLATVIATNIKGLVLKNLAKGLTKKQNLQSKPIQFASTTFDVKVFYNQPTTQYTGSSAKIDLIKTDVEPVAEVVKADGVEAVDAVAASVIYEIRIIERSVKSFVKLKCDKTSFLNPALPHFFHMDDHLIVFEGEGGAEKASCFYAEFITGCYANSNIDVKIYKTENELISRFTDAKVSSFVIDPSSTSWFWANTPRELSSERSELSFHRSLGLFSVVEV
jgi:hypothetical protein